MEVLDIKPSLRQRQKRRDKRLHEEVIECRRRLGGDGQKKCREKGSKKAAQTNHNQETYPMHEGIRFMAKHNQRTWPSDNLEPLTRWLHTQVGRPWSEVYAELGSIARPDSMHGAHIRQHLWEYVCKSTWLDSEDNIVVANQWGWIIHPTDEARQSRFRSRYFIHPVSGNLQKMSDLVAPKKDQACPKKARFKLEKEKLRWKMRQGIAIEKKEESWLDLSKYAQIRTRDKRIAPGMLLDFRYRENIFRAKVENIIQRKGQIRRIEAGRSIWAQGYMIEFQVLVTECHVGSMYETGKSYRLAVFSGEATDWAVFDAYRLFNWQNTLIRTLRAESHKRYK
jgi:hypothetical protein